MKQSQHHELHLLNELIVATLASANTYQEVAAAIDDRFASVFRQHASVRQYVADQLQDQVRTLGGMPAHQCSILAAAHNVVVNDKDSPERGRAVLEETIARSEDHLSQQFKTALQDEHLSESNRELVDKGYRLVKAGRDHAWDLLKHHVEAH